MRTFRELKRALKTANAGGTRRKLALLGDTATQFLATAIKGEGVFRGMDIDLFEAEYSQVERQLLDPTSEYHSFQADFTVIFQSSHKLLETFSLMDPHEREHLAENRLSFIKTVCDRIDGRIICFNYPEIGDGVFGSYQNKVEGSFIYQIRKLNLGLMELSVSYPGLFICDLSELQSKFGRDFFFRSNIYVMSEMVLSEEAIPYVASRVLDIICAIEGQFRKCVILDLDNTLWGGVVGDDGWENIQLGHGFGIGKAFTEFQQWIKKLRERGIIVCICSKNDEDKAREPFEKNPEMVLKPDDIAVFIANWNNKADNIRKIQKILNIGFDSMVFLDDNPFERNIVRENIPGICVPELPDSPEDFLECLYALNLFETASYSEADKDRTKQYQTAAKLSSYAESFTNEADYLKSLEMQSEVSGFTTFNTPRVAQLSQRSNQFNLRTVRYTEDRIREMEESDRFECFSFTLRDKFCDNGLICVVILEKTDERTLFIDSWFMSCRVLSRGMENFTLNTIVSYAVENGFSRIIGEYIPTRKNQMVENHYTGLGFKPMEDQDRKLYVLDVMSYKNRECYIEIERK